MNDPEIKACPFCGMAGHLMLTTSDVTIDHRHTVVCAPGCGASGLVAESPSLAIERWNARVVARETEAAPNAGNIAGSVSANGSPAPLDLLSDYVNAMSNWQTAMRNNAAEATKCERARRADAAYYKLRDVLKEMQENNH